VLNIKAAIAMALVYQKSDLHGSNGYFSARHINECRCLMWALRVVVVVVVCFESNSWTL
jgi:hypothetical protein